MPEPRTTADPLVTAWNDALDRLGGRDPARRTLAAVRDAYREPHRRYHDAGHLRAVVTATAAATDSGDGPSPHLVLAACYHDVVYDPRRGDNEAASAARAVEELAACGIDAADAARVAAAVEATAHIGGATTTPAEVGPLLDADLAVLGSAPGSYRRYAAQVRAEYAHVSDGDWLTGRAEVLRVLADGELFATPGGRERYAAAAHRNLRWELGELAAGRICGRDGR
ncbi:MAG: hypothetical protein S0880_04740 [Actinomycetota bacterium]|nr:hypothetical protein [Actinomycetota bacterium]